MPRVPGISFPRLREPQAQLLILGLAVGYGLFLSQLGLRWTVLVLGLVPPIGAVAVWQRQEHQRKSQDVTTLDLLDPALFTERLNQLIDRQPLLRQQRTQWRLACKQLLSIHSLIVRCVELDTADMEDMVDLLVLLDTLLDHADHLASCLHQLGRAATPGAVALVMARTKELTQHLSHTLRQLQSCHDSNLRETLQNQVLPARPLITPFPPLP